MRLNPHHPERFWSHLGKAHFAARQYSEAIEAFMRMSTMECLQHAFVAATYAQLGDKMAAAAHIAQAKKMNPDFSIDAFLDQMHYGREEDANHLREGLEKAEAAQKEAA
jgi:adenylate cyclase